MALSLLDSEGLSERAVHGARKASKRARATLALLRPIVGRAACRRVDRHFRDAARVIAPLRDADVLRHTLERVGEAAEAVPPRPEGCSSEAIDAYRVARDAAAALPVEPTKVLLDGVTRSWERARQTCRAVRADDAETMHTWRKAVKQLGYQVQLLTDLAPQPLSGLAAQLDSLQEALGDHHDLVVAELKAAGREAAEQSTLQERRRTLEMQTRALGAWLFAASPRRFASWLTAAGPQGELTEPFIH